MPTGSEPPTERVAPRGGLHLGISHDRDDGTDTADRVEAALRRLGHDVERLGAGPELFDALRARDPARRLDGVVNLASGRGDRGRASQVPALLTTLGIPHTGADPLALALACDDALARSFAAAHGIRTISGAGLDDLFDLIPEQNDPLPALDEQLPGDEYSVGILGNGTAAAVVAVTCRGPLTRQPRRPRSDERFAQARAIALDVHRVFGCRDASRVLLRCDRTGAPSFVTVDPLPDLHPAGDLARGARRRGWFHDELIRRFLAAAVARWQPHQPHQPSLQPDEPLPAPRDRPVLTALQA